VEKKRRYKINDCIQELAQLLPVSYDIDLNKKKGYILEKSVEYIQKLQADRAKKIELERRHRELEKQNRKLLLELQVFLAVDDHCCYNI
ncbi:hypothetical protein HELRODRAFT_68174, partial [Helobdella robusta]|uniref:BHLH domain-containing protein n=1 Tax=Helobdella robusta TaxID=6412 RepID=T1FZB3_HELRO